MPLFRRVLNGSEKVSEKTRKKVLAVMEENSYTPNAFARSLGLNSMHTVGILCSDSSDVYQAQAIYYLERELRKNSYASMLCCTGYELLEKQSYLNLLLSRNVDAVLLIGSHFIENSPEENRYILEAASKIPVFILNGELKGDNIYSILCDDYMALKDMTDLVFARGSDPDLFIPNAQLQRTEKNPGISGFVCGTWTGHISEKCVFRTGRLAQSMFYLRTTRCRRHFF